MEPESRTLELARRRGFIWPAFELYGGAAGFYDYGPLGATLKHNIESKWRQFYVIQEGFHEIESTTVTPEPVFIASGHVSSFTDPLVECQECHTFFRADHIVEEAIGDSENLPEAPSDEMIDSLIHKHNIKCPECDGAFGEVHHSTLMFKTHTGPGTRRVAYLRPETAQAMFVDFQRLLRYNRDKLPFGAAQIGRAYRNEISPRQGVIRLREFTLAEVEIFIDPRERSHPGLSDVESMVIPFLSIEHQERDGEAEEMTIGESLRRGVIQHEYVAYHIARTHQFLVSVGIHPEKLRFRQHLSTERAHYASDCWDAEILTERYDWVEVVGIADRTNYDLGSHSDHAQSDLSVFIPYDEPRTVERIVITPNMGIIGPKFKDKAQKVVEALKALDESKIEQDPVEIMVDGELLQIGHNLFECEKRTETVSGESIIPHVIEPSYGIDRIVYGVLEHSFHTEMVEGEERVVLRLLSHIAPVQVAVLPLLSQERMMSKALEIRDMLIKQGFIVEYDDSGTIGRRYRRQDEIGTPCCITIDHDTLEDDTVTIRDRDTMEQVRVLIAELDEKLAEHGF